MATHSSLLAWRIPTDRGAWRATVCGVAQCQTWLSNWACMHAIPLISIQALMCNSNLFFFIAKYYPTVLDVPQLVYPLACWWNWCSLQILNLTNKNFMNIHTYIFVWTYTFVPLVCIFSSGMFTNVLMFTRVGIHLPY